MLFPQPQELTVDEPMEPVDGKCAECTAETLFRYRLADYRGWLRVVKCRSCLNVVSSEQIVAPPQATS